MAEFRITLFGFFAAFIWEMWQMPFYDQSGLTFIDMVQGCSLRSFGDAGIMVLAYRIAAWVCGAKNWLISPTKLALAAFLGTGVAITILIEHLAISFQFGWQYSAAMPREPFFGTGLVPIVMWILVPLATLWLARLPGPL